MHTKRVARPTQHEEKRAQQLGIQFSNGIHLVDDAGLATALDGVSLLENRLGLLDLCGGRGSALLLGNSLAEINAVVSLVPKLR
jgi:hypothetical protein